LVLIATRWSHWLNEPSEVLRRLLLPPGCQIAFVLRRRLFALIHGDIVIQWGVLSRRILRGLEGGLFSGFLFIDDSIDGLPNVAY
jgi:hypothetical protein